MYLAGFFTILILIGCYLGFVYDKFHTVVTGRIYRSGQLSGSELQHIIDKHGIKSIINLRGLNDGNEWYETEKETAEKNDVELYSLDFTSYKLPLIKELERLVKVLKEAEKPLLVHCFGGIDRAGMASAIALSIEKDPPLSDLKEQFSWKYFVFPFSPSTGPLLFSKYEKWLKGNKKEHNREVLLFWIKNEYVDYKGNIDYALDTVQNLLFERESHDEFKVAFNAPPGSRIRIMGWAFDNRNRKQVDNLSVVINDSLVQKAEFIYVRPDVDKHFKINKDTGGNVKTGWLAEFDNSMLPRGCHRVHLRVITEKYGEVTFPTRYSFCID